MPRPRVFDLAGRLTGLEHAKGGTNLGTYSNAYDAEDRLTSATVPTAIGLNTTDYAYDDTDQLTAADHTAQTDESYAYDANGNRTSGGSVVDAGNRIAEDATHTYLYDDAGNLFRETQKSNGAYRVYWWDLRDRLIKVVFRTVAGVLTQQVAYNYDAFNRLVCRQVDANGDGTFEASQTFVYDGNLIVLVFDETETVTNRLLWNDAAVDQLFADENDLGEVLWSLTDQQGSVGAVVGYHAGTDTTTVVNRLDYDAFGNVVTESNPAKTPLFRYTGRYHDPLTGKQWNLHRWYDSRTGRWISRDPIGFNAGDANLYRYVGNGPGNATDPTGLQDFDAYSLGGAPESGGLAWGLKFANSLKAQLEANHNFWEGSSLAGSHYDLPTHLFDWANGNGTDVYRSDFGEGNSYYHMFDNIYITGMPYDQYVRLGSQGGINSDDFVQLPGVVYNEAFHAYYDKVIEESDDAEWIRTLMETQTQYGVDRERKAEEAMSELLNELADHLAVGGCLPDTYDDAIDHFPTDLSPGHNGPNEEWGPHPDSKLPITEDLYYATVYLFFDPNAYKTPLDSDDLKEWYNDRVASLPCNK